MRKMKKGEAARRRASTTSRGRSRKEPCKWYPVVFVFCMRFLREKEREVWRVRWAAEEEEKSGREKSKEERKKREDSKLRTISRHSRGISLDPPAPPPAAPPTAKPPPPPPSSRTGMPTLGFSNQ